MERKIFNAKLYPIADYLLSDGLPEFKIVPGLDNQDYNVPTLDYLFYAIAQYTNKADYIDNAFLQRMIEAQSTIVKTEVLQQSYDFDIYNILIIDGSQIVYHAMKDDNIIHCRAFLFVGGVCTNYSTRDIITINGDSSHIDSRVVTPHNLPALNIADIVIIYTILKLHGETETYILPVNTKQTILNCIYHNELPVNITFTTCTSFTGLNW